MELETIEKRVSFAFQRGLASLDNATSLSLNFEKQEINNASSISYSN